MTTPEPKWRERFVKTFFVYKLGGKFPDHVGAEKEAVAFIQQLIKEERLELLEEVKEKVEKMGETNPLVSLDRNDGYEIACDDILKKLSKAINEMKK